MFKIKEHKQKTITVELKSAQGDVLETFELAGIGYHKWNELGLLVTTARAPKKKDPKNPEKYIEDTDAQAKLDEEANMLRNAVRLVYALENGGGIDWGDDQPDNLLDKARAFQDIDADTFTALINALHVWLYGKRVSASDAINRFP